VLSYQWVGHSPIRKRYAITLHWSSSDI